MKRSIKLPTIIGLLVLTAGLVAGVFLINSRAIFKLGAQAGTNPKNVRITNITTDSITVSWVTDKQADGFVKWGNSKGSTTKVAQDNVEGNSFTHSASIFGVSAGSDVYFTINSGGQDWDNEGLAWQSKTLTQKVNSSETLNISGTVVSSTGTASPNSLVYVSVSGIMLSSVTSSEGNWFIPLSNYVQADPNSTVLEISVDAGPDGTATAIIYPSAAKNTPPIVLGKGYDFRTRTLTETGSLPQSNIEVPEESTASSRFDVSNQGGDTTKQKSITVTLDSVEEDEIITTTDPEFFGKAPAGTNIEIIVESEVQTASITAGSSGSWSWSPPAGLEPGKHTVTIKWTDTSGITKAITRTFVVSAAEGPAFESTPSATPTQTSSPTATPTTKPTATATATATAIATLTASPAATIASTPSPTTLPDAGVLTPTIGLFIMGLGVFMSSIYIWKTADA